MSSPVDHLLPWKLENIEKATKELQNKTAQKENFASNSAKYISNGVKNWALLDKHVALLQKKCNGNPPKHNVTCFLDEAVCENEMRITVPHTREKGINPKHIALQQPGVFHIP